MRPVSSPHCSKTAPSAAPLPVQEKTTDYVVGFDELGGKDDFSTEVHLCAHLQAKACNMIQQGHSCLCDSLPTCIPTPGVYLGQRAGPKPYHPNTPDLKPGACGADAGEEVVCGWSHL